MKIDIERLLCSLIECNTKSEHKYNWLADDIITSLRDQGLIYKDGQIIPKLRESEDEKIRKEIIDFLELPHPQFVGKRDHEKWIAWLEKQGKQTSGPRYIILDKLIEADNIYQMSVNDAMVEEAKNKAIEALSKLEISKLLGLEKQDKMDMESYKAAEDEKREFVGDGFIKCYADFQDFKEGETYWLEYIGNDNFNVRSDNLLGKTYHITPCQLYTIFKKMTWLEKQGEQKESYDTCNSSMMDNKKSPYSEKRDFGYFEEKSAEKQGEQKSADKIEPKFKLGDWVVHEMSDGRKVIRQIINMTNKSYVLDGEDFNTFYFDDLENNYHLWTIQEAKAGDVLAAKSGNRIFLYNGDCDLRHRPCAYCGTYKGFSEILFSKCAIGNYFTDEDVYPATKKQRDLLFVKMKEAGYEWDAETKELNKIEPFDKYEGLTDFERTLADVCIGWIGEENGWKQYIRDNADILLGIAVKMFNSVQDAPFEQKPTWSEEDEKIRKALIRFHKSTIEVDGIKGDDIVAWLEKQGEKDKLIKELGEYKVKYTQEVLKKTYK